MRRTQVAGAIFMLLFFGTAQAQFRFPKLLRAPADTVAGLQPCRTEIPLAYEKFEILYDTLRASADLTKPNAGFGGEGESKPPTNIGNGNRLEIHVDTNQTLRLSLRRRQPDGAWREQPFAALPVYIYNSGRKAEQVYFAEGQLLFWVEARTEAGDWTPIEKLDVDAPGADDYAGHEYLPPNTYLLTRVLRYDGPTSATLRVVLRNGKRLVYSQPFHGRIHLSQSVK